MSSLTPAGVRELNLLESTAFIHAKARAEINRTIDIAPLPTKISTEARKSTSLLLSFLSFINITAHAGRKNDRTGYGRAGPTPPKARRHRGGMMKRGWRIGDFSGVLISHPRHASSTAR